MSPSYRNYHNGPRWRARKAEHWASHITLKSCIVCGARRAERPLDLHELKYYTRGKGANRVMLDPPWWAVVPACAHPCHRWIITPLSHWPYVRGIVFVALGALALQCGAPVLWAAVATAAAIALPRIPEATFLSFILGLPFRVLRIAVRLLGRVTH